MNKRALGITAAIMLFTGLVATQVLSTKRPPLPAPVTLPDGSTLRLVQVNYDKEHFRAAKWWHPVTRRLPNSWQQRMKLDPAPSMATSGPSLGVWFVWDKPTPGALAGFNQWEFGLVDEQGVESPASSSDHYASDGTGPHLLGLAFTAFPRRDSVVTLRLYERGADFRHVLAATFQIPNPVRDKFPEWRPQPAPAVVKKGELEITFKQLQVERYQARASFQITERGVPSEHWVPDGIELADATGNVVRRHSWSKGMNKGEAFMEWEPFLWPREAAWKIRVEFMRNDRAVFSTNELIVVTGIELPATNEVSEVNYLTSRLGHSVRVLGLSSGGGIFRSRGHSASASGTRLEVDVSPDLAGKRLTVVSARDDQNRAIKSRHISSGGVWYTFGLDPQLDAKKLDITLAVQEVVTVEFTVKPERIVPAKAASGK